jgi:hypothetical protein
MAAESKSLFQSVGKVAFYMVIIACYVSAILLRKAGYFYDTPVVLFLLAGVAYSGIIGLLGDYAWRIRKTRWVFIPVLLLFEVLSELVYTAQFRDVAFYLSLPGALLYPVYGLLFLTSGFKLIKSKEPKLGLAFVVLGVLAASLVAWEYISLFPEDYSKSALPWRILYLANFGWLLFIEFAFPKLREKGYTIESGILSISLVAVSLMYLFRFLFT